MKGHFLNCELKLEHEGKVIKQPIGKLGGEIEYTLPNRKKVVLPFKSFVKTFLDEVYNIAASNSGGVKRKVSGIAGTAGETRYGILLGASSTDPLTTANFTTRASEYKLKGPAFNYSAMTLPTAISHVISTDKDLVTYYFDMSRTFTNNTAGTNAVMNEVYLTASNGTGNGWVLYAVDKYKNITQSGNEQADSLTITPGSVVSVTFRFQMARAYSTGGALMGLAKMIFNVLMSSSITSTSLQRYNGNSTEGTYKDYAVYRPSETTGNYHGIVVGYVNTADGELDNYVGAEPNLYNGGFVAHTGLTLGTNTVSSVSQVGDTGAQFTVTRTIVNSSTTSKTITHIGLFGHGGTESTSSINNDAIPYAFNKVAPIVLAPNQTLRITYTFSAEI